MVPYSPGTTALPAVEELLQERDIFIAEVHDRLLQVQEYSKRYYNDHHRELEFVVADWVWLHLLHRQALSLVDRPKGKLGPQYAGPFQIVERIGEVAYRLHLPAGAQIHDVFHVGLLKRFHGDLSVQTPPLPALENGHFLPLPAKVLQARVRHDIWDVRVQWASMDESQATWKPLAQFKESYSEFQLEDKLFAEVGRDVMVGIPYRRCMQQPEAP